MRSIPAVLVRALTPAVTVLLVLTRVDSAPAAEPGPGANAALKYWQAFSQVNPDEEQEKLLENWSTAPLDARADKLLDAARPALLFLRRGARIGPCDWSLDYEDGPGLLLPHLAKARQLTKLAVLHARREFAQGRPQAAVVDALAVLTLARHANADFTLISILVRCANEAIVYEMLAPHLPALDAASLQKLAAALDAPRGGGTVADSIRGEKKYMAEWLIRKLREAEEQKAGSYRAVLESVMSPAKSPEDRAHNEAALKAADTFPAAIRLLEGLLPVYDELTRLYALPPKEFDVRYPEFEKKAKAANAFAALLMPALDKVAAAERRNLTQRALCRAAIDIVMNGPARAEATKDPFGDGPFAYRAFDGGFELKSKFKFKDQPVTLTAGRARK